jgi:hypothetical protein
MKYDLGGTRRSFLAGAMGLAGAYALGCGERIPALEDAVKDESLRQAYLSAHSKGYNFIYDPGFSKFKAYLQKRGFPICKVELGREDRITILQKPFTEELYQDYLRQAEPGMVTVRKIDEFGTGKNPEIFVGEIAFRDLILPGDKKTSETYFLSCMEHEIQHAKDIRDGIDLGNGLRIGSDESIYLSLNTFEGLMNQIMEVRAHGTGLKYLHEKCGRTFAHPEEIYRDNLGKILKLTKTLTSPTFGKLQLADILESVLKAQLADPVLRRVIDKR